MMKNTVYVPKEKCERNAVDKYLNIAWFLFVHFDKNKRNLKSSQQEVVSNSTSSYLCVEFHWPSCPTFFCFCFGCYCDGLCYVLASQTDWLCIYSKILRRSKFLKINNCRSKNNLFELIIANYCSISRSLSLLLYIQSLGKLSSKIFYSQPHYPLGCIFFYVVCKT